MTSARTPSPPNSKTKPTAPGDNVIKHFYRRRREGQISSIVRPRQAFPISGLYYKHVTVVNASSSFNKLKASLNDDDRVVIYDRHMFIVQATGLVFAGTALERSV
jgi:hypothetical protein